MNTYNKSKIAGLGTWSVFEKGMHFYVPMGVIFIEPKDCSNYNISLSFDSRIKYKNKENEKASPSVLGVNENG
jgi:hypothetical protein